MVDRSEISLKVRNLNSGLSSEVAKRKNLPLEPPPIIIRPMSPRFTRFCSVPEVSKTTLPVNVVLAFTRRVSVDIVVLEAIVNVAPGTAPEDVFPAFSVLVLNSLADNVPSM